MLVALEVERPELIGGEDGFVAAALRWNEWERARPSPPDLDTVRENVVWGNFRNFSREWIAARQNAGQMAAGIAPSSGRGSGRSVLVCPRSVGGHPVISRISVIFTTYL